MISTGIDKRVQVQEIINNQLPEFVLAENPKVADFLKQYYISQEYRGGPIDIVDNLDQYLKLDNLTPEVITAKTNLSAAITTGDVTISVDSTKGYPDQYGLLKIDNEIFTYTGKTSTNFTGCVGGFSGITSYHSPDDPGELVFEGGVDDDIIGASDNHDNGSIVQNLSALFLQEFYKKLKYTFTPGFENSKFVSNLDVNNFIKEARTFYQSKGTEESFKILFNVLYDTDPKVIDLEEYLVKPSSAKYIRRERIVAEKIIGDPLKLSGQTISQLLQPSSSASISQVELISGISGLSTSKEYYSLDIFIGFDDEEYVTGSFSVPGKTKVIGDVLENSPIISVDSTVGFGTTGSLIISGINTNINYQNKTINQFLDCTNVVGVITSGTDLRSNEVIFGYENGDLNKRVELRITGVLSKFNPNPSNILSIEGETIDIKSIGEIIKDNKETKKEVNANSWIYNTASSYEILEQSLGLGEVSEVILKTGINKASLSVGDTVEIVTRSVNPFSIPKVKHTSIVNQILDNKTKIVLTSSFVNDSTNQNYSIRRVLKTASMKDPTLNLLKYGNNINSDIQNTYVDSKDNLYVATNSLPSYEIDKNILTISIDEAKSTGTSPTIQDYDSGTQLFQTISFETNIPFITGDAVYYKPETNPLIGLTEGIYFIKNITNNKIRLYSGPSFIQSNTNLKFGIPSDSKKHTFTLLKHYDKKILPRKLLKKLPLNPTVNFKTNTKTVPGTVGVLINGVEIENGKSTDSIFYGPLDNISTIGVGTDFDVINPPFVDISAGLGTNALAKAVISGYLKKIDIDPQNFDIEDVISLKITGGNSTGTNLRPILKKRNRILEFNGKLTSSRGDIDSVNETIVFQNNHNLKSGQVLIYNRNNNPELGIGTFKGSNIGTKTLVDGSPYWPEVLGISSIRLYPSERDYMSGINTIGFTAVAKSGIHKFTLKDATNTLDSVEIINSDIPFSNRELIVKQSGISTDFSTIEFTNHKFSNGENIQYESVIGVSTFSLGIATTGTLVASASTITGISTSDISVGQLITCDTSGVVSTGTTVTSIGIGTVFISLPSLRSTGFTTSFNFGSLKPSIISGLSTTNQYKVLKIDDNKFRLADAGTSGIITSNYNRNNYVKFQSSGIGDQIFKYPKIEITPDIIYPISTSDNVVLTPTVHGTIEEILLYENGTGYGNTSIINYEIKPDIIVKNGRSRSTKLISPDIKPIISNGKIISINIGNGGAEYYSTPSLEVVGDGVGAKIRPIIDRDPSSLSYLKIKEVKILRSGSNYTDSNTSIKVIPAGSGEVLEPNVRKLSLNNIQTNLPYDIRYSDDILEPISDGLRYSIVGYSTNREEFNFLKYNSLLSSNHSPIIGWAYDGNPIYGPRGFSKPFDTSETKILNSSYVLDSSNIEDRPSNFNLGFFSSDYKFNNSGDLDIHNGRYCKTPDYPEGVYAYFVSIDENTLEPKFPYFIGDTYRSNPISLDKDEEFTQNFDFNNSDLIRNTFPYNLSRENMGNDYIIESDEIIKQITKINSVTPGSVDNLQILNSGDNYKIGESLRFDDSNTEGSGLNAIISSLKGKPITDVETSFNQDVDVQFVWKDSSKITAFISTSHTLTNGADVIVSGLSSNIQNLSGSHKIGVSSESTILYKQVSSNSSAGIITDIFVGRTSLISVGSSIGIGTEKLLVLNKFDDRNVLRVKRGVTGTPHTVSTSVNLIPSFLTLPVQSNFFESKLNDFVYFNARQSVGVATISGITSSVRVSVGDTSSIVSVPSQSIYLPNHKFTTGQKVKIIIPSTAGKIGVSPDGTIGAGITLTNNSELFVINKSDNYIGIVTTIGLTTSTNGLFFIPGVWQSSSDNYEYAFESTFDQVTGLIETISTKVSVSTNHNLIDGNIINLSINPNQSVGIGTSTSVRVKYNSQKDKLLINTVGFTSAGVNTSTNRITINSHGYETGDKIFYDSTDEIISGLSTGGYFVRKINDNQIQLSETRIDAINLSPSIVSLVSIGGSEQQLSLINPPINVVRNNNLVFDVSDSSLSGYNLKMFYDNKFVKNFVSVGNTNVFSVSGIGTVGVASTASVTLRYSDNLPLNLFYNIEKSGFISTSDVDVFNGSRINFVNSEYNGNYSVFGVGNTTFNVLLEEKPESLRYKTKDCKDLDYSTSSTLVQGPINELKINFGGFGYKQMPKFVSVATTTGTNAKIIPISNSANKIYESEIQNIGFEYASDKTLLPIANISPVISLRDSDMISEVSIINGGSGYQNIAPQIVVVDINTRKVIDNGFIQANISPATQSITSVNIIQSPKGIDAAELFTINNTNGVGISTISIGSTIVNSIQSGLVTCTLETPIAGFSVPPFKVGDKIFIEGIENDGSYGDTLNSSSNGFKFYPITNIVSSNPFRMEFNVNGISTNPGFAKTIQNFANVINFDNYPKFNIIQKPSSFSEGEELFVLIDGNYVNKGLTLDKVGNNYIKINGKYDLKRNDIIRGSFSGSIATINSLTKNTGSYTVDFSSRKNKGWITNTGKLNEDYQVLPDNDYYQTLSYTVQSPIEYKELITPVNLLVHTTGLKNFSDTGITSTTSSGLSTVTDSTSITRSLSSENRVDVINNFDFVKDVDILSNPTRSKYVQFKSRELANYFECRSNRVLSIDNINTLFRDSSNHATVDGTIELANSFNRFLIQSIDPITNNIQSTELITSIDFVNNNSYNIQKGSLSDNTLNSLSGNDQYLVDIIASEDTNNLGNFKLNLTPVDIFDTDLDIQVLNNQFTTSGVGSTSIGFTTLTGITTIVAAATTSNIIQSNISNIDSFFATVEVKDTFANEINVSEIYVTHDGTNSIIGDYTLESNTTNAIGTFTSEIDSNNILYLKYSNDRNNNIEVRSRIVGFGTTASGIGTYRFKTSLQPDGSENSARYQSNFTNITSTGSIVGFTSSKDSTVKSLVRVSIGQTSAIHQILLVHNGTSTFTEQYPFISIGSTSGIGTFSSEYSGSNLNLKFHPDASFTGVGNLQIQSFNEILNTEIDTVNIPPDYQYGSSQDSLSVLRLDSANSVRYDNDAFKLRYKNKNIFSRSFSPTSTLNLSTGVFNIEGNFFNNNERLIYKPGSSISSVGISSLVMSNGNPLPSEVYVKTVDGGVNENLFRLSTSLAGAAVTFNTFGTGNFHSLEMFKKTEKSLIALDDIIQSPLTYTPVTTTLTNNINGQVSISTSIINVSGISSIAPDDVIRIDDEYMRVDNVGLGNTSYGPVTTSGSLTLIQVRRGFVGSSASTHTDSATVRLYRGSYSIVGENIYFTEPPRGSGVNEVDDSNRLRHRTNFNGRVFLRQDYTTNNIYDDVSSEFSGIGRTFTTTVSGVNTVGLNTGSTLMTINGIFQRPTTINNPLNNYELDENVGVTSFVFTGITSANGSIIISEIDSTQNQLPRSGQIISIGSSGGLGIAPLVGASATVVTNASGTITSVGLGTTDFNGSGYFSSTPISIGVTDSAYDHTFVSSDNNSITVNANGIGGNTTFTPTAAPYNTLTGIVSLTKSNHNLITSDSYTATTGTVYDPNVGIMTVKLNSTPSPALVNGQLVKFENNSLRFTCDKDSHATNHDYPRSTDPLSGKWLPISNVSGGNQFEINVLDNVPSTNTGIHTFVSATNSGVNRSANTISIATTSLVYTCSKDDFKTLHLYPRTTDPAYNTALSIIEATNDYFKVSVGSGGGSGSGANITATVGVGGTLTFNVVSGGSGYINPQILPPSPSYENLDVIGVSRLGIGATTETGKALRVSLEVGSSSTTGIGSTLFEVKGFKITRDGFAFKKGDVFKPIGIVTDKQISSLITPFEFTVNEIFTDRFSAWNFGELDYLDDIAKLQDGVRRRFPMSLNNELLSFKSKPGAGIVPQDLLLIFINGVIQEPGISYEYDGGTSFILSEPPDKDDNVAIFFYRGKDGVDIVYTDVEETIKAGDDIRILKLDGMPSTINQTDNRTVLGITTSDTIETELYVGVGIDDNFKPLNWIKQKSDLIIDGEPVSKSRPSIEPLVFPDLKLISGITTTSTDIYVDSVGITTYDMTNASKINFLISDQSTNKSAASLTAVLSGSKVQSIAVNDGGTGYVGSTTSVSISQPRSITGYGLTSQDFNTLSIARNTPGIASTYFATGIANIVNGSITNVNVTNSGFGYTVAPTVLAPFPEDLTETISEVTKVNVSGFSGIVTAITAIGNTSIKFYLNWESGDSSTLVNGLPIYISNTSIGTGVTAVNSSGSIVGIGTTFLDNIYNISGVVKTVSTAEFVAGIQTNSTVVGIGTTGKASGRFSWGKISGVTRSSNPIEISVSNKTVNSGLTTYPSMQRRNFGIRNSGGINKPQ